MNKIKIRLKMILVLIISLFFISNIVISNFFVSEGFIGGKDDKILTSAILPENSSLKEWNMTWGGSEVDQGLKVIVDSSNNTYVVGCTSSFGNGEFDVVVIKFNSVGEIQWNMTWGGNVSECGYDIIMDLFGDIYITGVTTSFGKGDWDIVVIKYNKMGEQLWNRTWGGTNKDLVHKIIIDSSNNAYIIGNTYSFGNGESDIFVVKYNSVGDQLWNRTWGGSDFDTDVDAILDPFNHLYVSGVIGKEEINDMFGHTFIVGGDAFLVKFNQLGEELWNKTWGESSHILIGDCGHNLALDSSNNVYITGEYGVYYQPEIYSPRGGDIFLFKYNSSGKLLWNRFWEGPIFHTLRGLYYDVVVDGSDNIYVLGAVEKKQYFSNITLRKYNNIGECLWNKIWANYEMNWGFEIEFDSNDDIYILGITESGYDHDIAILHYNQTGKILWDEIWNESTYEWGHDMYIDTYNNIFIVGCIYIEEDNYDMVLIKFFYIRVGIENEIPGDIIFLIMILSLVSLIIIIFSLKKRINKPINTI